MYKFVNFCSTKMLLNFLSSNIPFSLKLHLKKEIENYAG